MKSSTSASFRKQFAELSPEMKRRARKQFLLWLEDHLHPSLHFKRVGPYWSVRVDRDHRALGVENDGTIIWFYIGKHDGYERRI